LARILGVNRRDAETQRSKKRFFLCASGEFNKKAHENEGVYPTTETRRHREGKEFFLCASAVKRLSLTRRHEGHEEHTMNPDRADAETKNQKIMSRKRIELWTEYVL
jgi:hypothetical protein